jgi:hypothetical protein
MINRDGSDVAVASAEFGILNQTVISSCEMPQTFGVGSFVEKDVPLSPGT